VDLVEVVVAVPFEAVGREAEFLVKGVRELGDAARQRGAGIGDAVAHGVAETDFDGDAAFLAEFQELFGKGQAEPVNVCAGDVLKMAAGNDAFLESGLDDGEIFSEGLSSVLLELEEDVVIGDGREDAGLLETEVFDDFEVVGVGSNPAGDLGESISESKAAGHCFAVASAVDEELGLADNPSRSAETVHHAIEVDDLLRRIRRSGLLTVAEGGVGDPDFLCWVQGHDGAVEEDSGHFGIGELLTEESGFRDVFDAKDLSRRWKRAKARCHGRISNWSGDGS